MATKPGLHVEATIADIKVVADRLRLVDKELPGKLRYLLHKAARPIMREQRRTIRGLPSDDSDNVELRDIIARGLRLTVRTGGGRRTAAYRIRTTMPQHPDGKHWAMLPRGLDTAFNGWRSPYFGNRSHWVHHQVTGPSWFMGPAQEAQPELKREVKKLLAMSAAGIARAAQQARSVRATSKQNKG